MRIAKLILSTLFTICILGLVAGGVLYFHLKSSLPSVESLKTVELQQPMQIYTADGKLIGEVGEQRRIPVKLENVPQRLQDAFLATEDSRFYDHHGLDPVGIARAIFVAVNNGGASQGASTITQQLARNFFLTPEKTIIRKAREAVLAIEIENALSKQEILELYLNKIFLGYRSYGVAAAAQTYFGKNLDELTLSEMADHCRLTKSAFYHESTVFAKTCGRTSKCGFKSNAWMRIKSPKQNMMQRLKSQSSQAITVLNLSSVQTM